MAAAAVVAKKFDITLAACVLGAVGMLALSAIAARFHNLLTDQQTLIAFAAACGIPFLASWRQAILDGRLPALPNGTPKHDHITGWGFLGLAGAIAVIVLLAAWASADENAGRTIRSDWGIGVVFGLAIAFAAAALLPILLNNLSPQAGIRKLALIAAPIGWIARPFGILLSIIDSIIVFAVAGGAGAGQPGILLRYLLLACSIIPCAIMGYYLSPPFGIVPIIWGFIVAISISRRWAWIEDDREIYMLNRRYNGAHLRIGFSQDLRDEALLSFMSMFFLVPLALRQADMWADLVGAPIFKRSEALPPLLDWIGYYGTELAKAVPFVDWAEIYQVEGAAAIEAESDVARHVVFATRVLVDLVFLAALLQALSISARNAKQMDLFKAGVMDRLDPFVEPREFRKLIQKDDGGNWQIDPAKIAVFPKYDPLRLAELSAPEHSPINIAAKALRRRDGVDDDVAEFYETLLDRAFQKKKDAAAIEEVLTAIRMTDAPIQADDLDRARIELNQRRSMNGLREMIMRMIARSVATPERWAALKSALVGETQIEGVTREEVQDAIASVRRIALEAASPMAQAGDPAAINVIDRVSMHDPSKALRKEAADILSKIRQKGLS